MADDSWQVWLEDHFSGEQLSDANFVGDLADPDGDGQNNRFEFLAKMDPMDRESRLRLDFAGESKDWLRLEPVVDGIAYEIQTSDDLVSWNIFELGTFSQVGNGMLFKRNPQVLRALYRVAINPLVSTPEGFSLIPAGTFFMGSLPTEAGRYPDEVRREVNISRNFFMGQTEVSKAEWDRVRAWGLKHGYSDLAVGRSGFREDSSDQHPVTEVSWYAVVKWLNAKSEMEGGLIPCYSVDGLVYRTGISEPDCNFSNNGYRLPTEAEWEYGCRAGTIYAFYTGKIVIIDADPLDPNLDRAGWYVANSDWPGGGKNTHPVGDPLKEANAWGLRDTHGNVMEWCWDWWRNHIVAATDPVGPASGKYRILRGGHFYAVARDCRSGIRGSALPDNSGFWAAYTGFRIARSQ